MEDIAIIGIAGRFPDAENIDQLWKNITKKTESISFFNNEELVNNGVSPTDLEQTHYIKAKGYLKNASMFDAKFFNITQREAEILDPQFRLFLETAWEAMENAAYIPGDKKSSVGIFASASSRNNYYVNNILKNKNASSLAETMSHFTANAKDFLSTLVAYKLNLTGPCMTIQTACSSSLVAICQACENLLNDRCDIALAGGVCVTTPLKSGYFFQEGMILSKDGHCKPFDENASGTVAGNGVGILVLKKLERAISDNDYIHAIIKGYAINNDGNQKLGFYAPSIKGQQKVIELALERAKLKSEMIDYIETHGTGTYKGDPVEIAALSKTFNTAAKLKKTFLGALKANIGHLDVASGVASCIKTIEALKHRLIPPNLHFQLLNKNIQPDMPFSINSESIEWEKNSANTRYAGISSFGIGGTNAHIILQEAPTKQPSKKNNIPVLFPLSATALSMLVKIRRRLAAHLKQNPNIDLEHVGFTLQNGRKPFSTRYACICTSVDEAIEKLENVSDRTGLAYGLNTDEKNQKLFKLHEIAQRWLTKDIVDWKEITYSKSISRLPLPTYPFERKEYWIYPDIKENSKTETWASNHEVEEKILNIFKYFLGMDKINSIDDFYDFGGDSLLSLQVIAEVNKQLGLNLTDTDLAVHSSAKKLTEHINKAHEVA